jgi:putative FmdB family regulatory protein
MPVYEYLCKACKHEYSEILTIKESEDVPACPSCGSEDVQKLISSVSVVRSAQQKAEDRSKALADIDPTNPQEVARHFRDHGSQFGEDDFRGTKEWHDAVDRVADGGPTLDE